jgi:flagellar hook-associated protein 3 FlgL
MRISQNYGIESLLLEINRTRSKIDELQSNLSSGKRVSKLSDDPENINALFRFKTALTESARYQKNIEDAINFMTVTSQALDDAINILSSIKESAIRGITNIGDNQWAAEGDQVNHLLKEIVDIANTRFQDRFVFGGSSTKDIPFTLSSDEGQVLVNPDGVDGNLKILYGNSQIENYNVSGEAAFRENVDIFQTLVDLRDAILAKDSTAIEGLLVNIDDSIDQLSLQNANIGGKINRFESYLQQYQSLDIHLQDMLSRIEDTDMAKAIMELQKEEISLNATLQVFAKTSSISLMDYLG